MGSAEISVPPISEHRYFQRVRQTIQTVRTTVDTIIDRFKQPLPYSRYYTRKMELKNVQEAAEEDRNKAEAKIAKWRARGKSWGILTEPPISEISSPKAPQ